MENKNKYYRKKYDVTEKVVDMINSVNKRNDGVIADPNGSYTGTPIEAFEKPVQDADDL